MTPLEKTEQQIEKAYADLNGIREKKSDIIEREKQALTHIAELENQRIVQIVQVHSLDGTQLKAMLANIKAKPNISEPTRPITIERKNENEENN